MTSNYRISQHGMDIVFKLEAEQLGSALARRYNIDLPPVARYFPTELPVADIHPEQLDSIFELEDERLLRLEFQSEHRGDTRQGSWFRTRYCTSAIAGPSPRSSSMEQASTRPPTVSQPVR